MFGSWTKHESNTWTNGSQRVRGMCRGTRHSIPTRVCSTLLFSWFHSLLAEICCQVIDRRERSVAYQTEIIKQFLGKLEYVWIMLEHWWLRRNCKLRSLCLQTAGVTGWSGRQPSVKLRCLTPRPITPLHWKNIQCCWWSFQLKSMHRDWYYLSVWVFVFQTSDIQKHIFPQIRFFFVAAYKWCK